MLSSSGNSCPQTLPAKIKNAYVDKYVTSVTPAYALLKCNANYTSPVKGFMYCGSNGVWTVVPSTFNCTKASTVSYFQRF